MYALTIFGDEPFGYSLEDLTLLAVKPNIRERFEEDAFMADFTMFKGDTKILEVTVLDQDAAIVDISSMVIKWQLSRKAKDLAPLVAKVTGAGITIVDGPNGRFDVLIDPADTDLLKARAYYHEAEANDGGVISTVMTGWATLVETLIPSP